MVSVTRINLCVRGSWCSANQTHVAGYKAKLCLPKACTKSLTIVSTSHPHVCAAAHQPDAPLRPTPRRGRHAGFQHHGKCQLARRAPLRQLLSQAGRSHFWHPWRREPNRPFHRPRRCLGQRSRRLAIAKADHHQPLHRDLVQGCFCSKVTLFKIGKHLICRVTSRNERSLGAWTKHAK